MFPIRPYLVLGRISNLTTVWSNVFCGWLLTANQNGSELLLILSGTSFLYLGGMYMNDLFDSSYDSQYRSERPIPAGQVSPRTVSILTVTFLFLGILLSTLASILSGLFAIALSLLIFFYNRDHKGNPFAPYTMAGCRALLFFVAGATASCIDNSITIAAACMFLYVAGVTQLAQKESGTKTNFTQLPKMPCILIATALCLATFSQSLEAPSSFLWLASLLTLSWILFALWKTRSDHGFIPGKAIAPLLAGIPLLDLIVVLSHNDGLETQHALFPLAMVLALIAQKFVPAS